MASKGNKEKKAKNGNKRLIAKGKNVINSLAMYNMVTEQLYTSRSFQSSLTDTQKVKLYSYFQQANVGINTENRPTCLLWFFGSKDENLRWQAWSNLGSMSKAKAIERFMETIQEVDPSYQNTIIESSSKSVMEMLQAKIISSIQAIARKRKLEKFLILFQQMLWAVTLIQTRVRILLAKKTILIVSNVNFITLIGNANTHITINIPISFFYIYFSVVHKV